LEFGPSGLVAQRSLEIPRAVPLLSLPEGRAVSMEALVTLLRNYAYGTADAREKFPFLEVRYLDDGPDPQRRYKIERALEGKPVRLAHTKFEPKDKPATLAPDEGEAGLGDLQSLDPLAVLLAAYGERYEGAEPEAALLSAFREILSEVNE
jgi:exonuclease SbcD